MDYFLPLRSKYKRIVLWLFTAGTLLIGVFFLGVFAVSKNEFMQKLISPASVSSFKKEVFGFAPFWTLSKLSNVDWDVLTTFAYFSLPVAADGSIDKSSYEWEVFEGKKVDTLFAKAKDHNVKRVVTLTQMDASVIEVFLNSPQAWQKTADDSIEIIKFHNLDGVNIDIEYIPSNSDLRAKFSDFMSIYTDRLNGALDNPYITVSVLASSERFNRIYDVGHLSKVTDGVMMMAYDFYYPGSDKIGPSAPLYGFDNGKGPFWYDVSTAVSDFLKVAPAEKIIMGVPYYGWNYPAYDPEPKTERVAWLGAFATTNEKVQSEQLLATTPVGGWDDVAKVSWRGYWDEAGWHVVYMEDKKSLNLKYDFIREKKLAGVGIWALGFDAGDDSLWNVLSEKFSEEQFASSI